MKNDLKIAGLIASRYFFSRKSTHAVNIIAAVAVMGIAVVTAAMVCILSIFNGFESFITSQFSTISPEYRIIHRDGKAFKREDCTSLSSFQETTKGKFACVFEAPAIANYGTNHTIANLLGVDSIYFEMHPVSSLLVDGEVGVGTAELPLAMVELGIAARLGAGVGFMEPLEVVVSKREGRISLTMPHRSFNRQKMAVTGVFQTDQPEYENLVILPLSITQELLEYSPEMITSIFMGNIQDKALLKQLETEIPDYLLLQNKVQQHPDIYKVLKVEKWISFALLVFVLILSLFSVISTLGMLIIEKKEDSKTLSILGARASTLDKIIVIKGWLLSITGLTIGLSVGLLLSYLQETLGFIKLEQTSSGVFVLEAYPVSVVWTDILYIIIVILFIGWISSTIAHKIFNKKVSFNQ
ncbi:ABC transporter permease [Porphyromonas sp.]|uniref:ABC transporter permease n=1 Tax=Porphyromonas sp. TaxID=1924944 RepID=UPI0026DC7B6A|nr:FtsX-like permease family protein [Porphyromonas sp.]MDO4695139.1 ABC transporter permease [Porphyromonas sp.]MDO4770217.1 ABC transporter permease [Porphyromonas sp.]